ncbi:hypothetical protein L6227_17690 [Pseudomonas syringae pv. syringae]|uniref:hypothetical protein n=1 Tax=Pseudomonas syringae TaxID=317 RepID=UPI001F0E8D85|nr:hypothetical protein [Pseudomonas syringae]MCH5551112.1 hypothetical protein [Pseudomonas syringae pv. syringae]
MIYSRALHVEFEHAHNEEGEGAYTVFNVIQPLLINRKPANEIMLQSFAILWTDSPDTRLIAMVEEALITGALSPVKLLHASKGSLCVVYNNKLQGIDYLRFQDAWIDIALGVWYDEWSAELVNEDYVGSSRDGGRLFRTFAPAILDKHDLGIKPLTGEMFLHHDDWTPDKIIYCDDSENLTDDQLELLDSDPFTGFEDGIPHPDTPLKN